MQRKKYAISEKITGQEIKRIRNKLGLTQLNFACLVNVSQKTIERWEKEQSEVTGPIVTLCKIFDEIPAMEEELCVPDKVYSMRLWYKRDDSILAVIDVEESEKSVRVKNFTNDNISRPFGTKENPTYEDYTEFLKSRCFPETRDKLKIELKKLDLPFYDPLLIIEKTQGRLAEDDFWIEIER